MAEMEKETLISKAVDYILSAFKGRAIQKIGGKLNDALQNEILIQWNKIEPIFIEPIKDDLETKKRETQKVFKAVSEGIIREKPLVKAFLLLINQQFLLFAADWIKSVQEDFLIVFMTPINENR